MAIDESNLLGALADSNIYDNVGITNTLPEFPILSVTVRHGRLFATVYDDSALMFGITSDGRDVPVTKYAGPRNPDEMYAHAVDLLRKVENRQLPLSEDDVRIW